MSYRTKLHFLKITIPITIVLTLLLVNVMYVRHIETTMNVISIVGINIIIIICVLLIHIISRSIFDNEVVGSHKLRLRSEKTEEFEQLAPENNIETDELNTILNAVKEGILVLSDQLNVLHYNKSFCSQFSIEDNIHRLNYRQALRKSQLINLVDTLIKSEANYLSEEFSFDSKTLLLSASVSKNEKFYVCIFHDVSEIRAIEKMKKDFVINASHELRTPLTSIKGFLELAERESNQPIKYLDVISRNTDRIINIINDLLKLSKLESGNNPIQKETHDINDIILNNIILFQKRIDEKKLKLVMDLSKQPLFCKVDKLKIEEVIINLVDNAVKYTEYGCISIITTLEKDPFEQEILPHIQKERINIHIRDTGIGIPVKYQARIFERFFVVDKARSRRTGGTGLGLAIVKHIIQAHNGSIDIKHIEAKGTEFIISLPLA